MSESRPSLPKFRVNPVSHPQPSYPPDDIFLPTAAKVLFAFSPTPSVRRDDKNKRDRVAGGERERPADTFLLSVKWATNNGALLPRVRAACVQTRVWAKQTGAAAASGGTGTIAGWLHEGVECRRPTAGGWGRGKGIGELFKLAETMPRDGRQPV